MNKQKQNIWMNLELEKVSINLNKIWLCNGSLVLGFSNTNAFLLGPVQEKILTATYDMFV